MRRLILVSLSLVIALGIVNPCAYAMKIKYTFAFADRFPDEAAPLGFTPGNSVQVGAVVKAGDFTITEATATNLDTGVVLNLVQRNIGAAYTNLLFLHWPFPPLDPDKHKGVWEIRFRDEKGNEAVAKSHRLDKVRELPYVENIKASGSRFAPTITWTALKEGDYSPECKIKYRVRLLKNNGNQFYKTKKLSSEPKDEIPKGILKYEDIPDTYIRIETQCWDSESDHPVPVETKSETFRPLVEAFGQ